MYAHNHQVLLLLFYFPLNKNEDFEFYFDVLCYNFLMQTSVNQKQKTIVTFLTSCRKGKRRSLLTVKSVLNNTIPSFKDNGTAEEPSKILLDKLFARTHEHTNENLVYPPDEALSYSTLGGLGLTFKLR